MLSTNNLTSKVTHVESPTSKKIQENACQIPEEIKPYDDILYPQPDLKYKQEYTHQIWWTTPTNKDSNTTQEFFRTPLCRRVKLAGIEIKGVDHPISAHIKITIYDWDKLEAKNYKKLLPEIQLNKITNKDVIRQILSYDKNDLYELSVISDGVTDSYMVIKKLLSLISRFEKSMSEISRKKIIESIQSIAITIRLPVPELNSWLTEYYPSPELQHHFFKEARKYTKDNFSMPDLNQISKNLHLLATRHCSEKENKFPDFAQTIRYFIEFAEFLFINDSNFLEESCEVKELQESVAKFEKRIEKLSIEVLNIFNPCPACINEQAAILIDKVKVGIHNSLIKFKTMLDNANLQLERSGIPSFKTCNQ